MPSHRMCRISSTPQLLAPSTSTVAATSNASAPLAKATLSFDPATGRLLLGASVCGGSGKVTVSGVPSTALPLKVFRTTDLFELVRDTESGASAVGLAILSNGRAACSLGLLHGSLSSLLDVLHNAPPRLATASKCTADERTPDGPLYEMLTVLVAQVPRVVAPSLIAPADSSRIANTAQACCGDYSTKCAHSLHLRMPPLARLERRPARSCALAYWLPLPRICAVAMKDPIRLSGRQHS